MRILSHYFVARFLGLFTMVLAVALLVLATVELVLNLDDVSSFGVAQANESVGLDPSSSELPSRSSELPPSLSQSLTSSPRAIANVLRYLGIRLTAYYLADLLPVASFIALFLTFALTGRTMERLAIEAGGIPPIRIILPVLASALILSFAGVLLQETVILRAQQAWSNERVGSPNEINFGRESFWLHKGPTITNVSHADPGTRTLYGVEIFERGRNGAVIRVIRADRVRIASDGRWHVEDARIWRFDPLEPSVDPGLEHVSSVVLDLESLRGGLLLGADPGLLPLADLVQVLEHDPTLTTSTRRRLESRLHERLSRPWLILVFAWLALPFGLRVDERGRFAGPAAASIAALGAYFLVESAGRTLAQQSVIEVDWAPWLTMLLFSLAATAALPRRRTR